MSMAQKYSRSPGLGIIRSEAGTLYIMSLPDGVPQSMNGPAEAIWEVAVSGSTQIVQELAEMFDVAPELLAGDVETTLQSLVDLGFIEPDGGSES